MKRNLRSTAAFLAALLMIPTVASCGGGGGSVTTDDPGTTEVTSSEETTEKTLEVRDLGGKDINILIRTEWNYEFMVDEESGDTVSDAIFRRNSAVEDKYKCNLNFIDFAGNWANHYAFTDTIHNSVLASDGAFDFIAGYQAVLTTNIQNGDLMNLYDVPNLNLKASHWTQEGVDALTCNGKCYEVGGDIAVSLLKGINCMFYNKKLAEDYSAPDFYQLVDDGKWTIDKVLEISKDVYKDLNGNGSKDESDQYGFASYKTYTRNYVVCFETPTITDGKLSWNNEHTISVVEKVVDMFNNNPDVYYADKLTDSEKMFTESRALLTHSVLGAAETMRAMDDDFGILPLPKWDEDQESYHTTTSNDVSMMCVPVTAPDPEVSGLILEAMCAESTETVAKAFYETALKGKYARDEDSLRMIELTRSVLTFDFGAVSSLATAVSGAQYETMITNNDKNFASWYASSEENIKNKVSAYLEIFSK